MRNKPNAFTLMELLVVIGIIGILVAILMPALSKARESAKLTTCSANIRQIVIGIHQYARQNKDAIPTGPAVATGNPFAPATWDAIASNQIYIKSLEAYQSHGPLLDDQYMPEPRVMFCPGDDSLDAGQELAKIRAKSADSYSSYLYRNKDQITRYKIDDLGFNDSGQAARLLVLDFNRYSPFPPPGENQLLHKGLRVNMGFVDGHGANYENANSAYNLRAMDYASFPTSVEARLNAILAAGDALQ